MTDEITSIFAGPLDADRAELHEALDALLDGAVSRMDAAAYWNFVARLARGRGIADEIEESAARMVVDLDIRAKKLPGQNRKKKKEKSLTNLDWARSFQWAVLFKLLRRLRMSDAVDGIKGSLLPETFEAWIEAVALNRAHSNGKGEEIDLLGTGSERHGGEDAALRRAARRMLVREVMLRVAITGKHETKMMIEVFGGNGKGRILVSGTTWVEWKREAKVAGIDLAKVARKNDLNAAKTLLTEEQIGELRYWACRPT
jgi:hypothetical protein